MNKFFLFAILATVAVATCPTDKKDCKDSSASCSGWATAKECTTNPDWMLTNCAKSCCGICTDDNVQGLTTCPTEKNKGQCVADTNDSCPGWAEFDAKGLNNQCLDNPDWMTPNCMQSCCTTCQIGADKCPTIRKLCKNKVKGKVCTTASYEAAKKKCTQCDKDDFTKNPCKKNSKAANAVKAGADVGQILACVEQKKCKVFLDAKKKVDTNCAAWKKQGECTKNPAYMNEFCPESCCAKCQANPPAVAPIRTFLPVQQPVRFIQQPIQRIVQQPVQRIVQVQQPVQRIVQQPVVQVQQPVQRIVQQPIVQQPVQRIVQQPIVQQPVQRIVQQQPVQRIVQQPIQRVAAQPIRTFTQPSFGGYSTTGNVLPPQFSFPYGR